MKVLHVYPESNHLIQRHVMMLTEGLRQSAEVYTASKGSAARQIIIDREPDIIHVHGCEQLFLLRTSHHCLRRQWREERREIFER